MALHQPDLPGCGGACGAPSSPSRASPKAQGRQKKQLDVRGSPKRDRVEQVPSEQTPAAFPTDSDSEPLSKRISGRPKKKVRGRPKGTRHRPVTSSPIRLTGASTSAPVSPPIVISPSPSCEVQGRWSAEQSISTLNRFCSQFRCSTRRWPYSSCQEQRGSAQKGEEGSAKTGGCSRRSCTFLERKSQVSLHTVQGKKQSKSCSLESKSHG